MLSEICQTEKDKYYKILSYVKSKKSWTRPGAVAHACNLSTLEGRGRRITRKVKRSTPSWPTWWNPISTKNTNISWAWWRAPVVPATQEAEAEELLELGRWRLQWAKIAPLHSSLAPGDRARLCLKKKRKNLNQSNTAEGNHARYSFHLYFSLHPKRCELKIVQMDNEIITITFLFMSTCAQRISR